MTNQVFLDKYVLVPRIGDWNQQYRHHSHAYRFFQYYPNQQKYPDVNLTQDWTPGCINTASQPAFLEKKRRIVNTATQADWYPSGRLTGVWLAGSSQPDKQAPVNPSSRFESACVAVLTILRFFFQKRRLTNRLYSAWLSGLSKDRIVNTATQADWQAQISLTNRLKSTLTIRLNSTWLSGWI